MPEKPPSSDDINARVAKLATVQQFTEKYYDTRFDRLEQQLALVLQRLNEKPPGFQWGWLLTAVGMIFSTVCVIAVAVGVPSFMRATFTDEKFTILHNCSEEKEQIRRECAARETSRIDSQQRGLTKELDDKLSKVREEFGGKVKP